MKCKLAFYMYKINATFFTVYIYIYDIYEEVIQA